VHLLDQVGGHLARAEARHAHLRGDFLHLALDPGLDILGRNRERIFALQAFIGLFDDLHLPYSNLLNIIATCPWRQELVRAKGFEPPHLAILEPKSSASTSSATPAARRIRTGGARLRNREPPLYMRGGKGKPHRGHPRQAERTASARRFHGKQRRCSHDRSQSRPSAQWRR